MPRTMPPKAPRAKPAEKVPARPKKAAAKKAPARKAATKATPARKAPGKAPAKKVAAKKAPPKKASVKEAPAPAAPPAEAPAKPKRTPAAPRAPVSKERVVVPKDAYEARKDEIKAPLKEHGLKWQYLGEGKGRYHKEGVNLFVQFLDDGVHYSLWGDDQATVKAIVAAWRALLGEAVFAQAAAQGVEAERQEEAQKESDAIRLWKLQEPQPRPGEPDFFFRKRVEEWQAKRPQG